MTTYQDQPWSRRAVRDDDQAETPSPADAVDSDTEVDDEAPFAPRATPLSPRGSGEPLNYVTQQRGADAEMPTFRPRRQPSLPDEAALPVTEQMPANETPRYRARDFSPEGRSGVPSWAPTYTQTPNPYAGGGSSLDWHTQVRPETNADPAAARPESAQPTEHSPSHTASHSHAATADDPATPTMPPTVISAPAAPRQSTPEQSTPAPTAFVAGADGSVSPTAEAPAATPSTSHAPPQADAAATAFAPETALPPNEAPVPRSAEPLAPPTAGAQVNVERTVTRRELRALRAAQEAAEAAALGAPSTGAPTAYPGPAFVDEPRVSQPPTGTHSTASAPAEPGESAQPAPDASESPAAAASDMDLDAWVASVFDGAAPAPAATSSFEPAPESAPAASPAPFVAEDHSFVVPPAPERPTLPEPIALVEPADTEHWSNGARPTTSPAVLDALFTPPSVPADDTTAADASAPEFESTDEAPADAATVAEHVDSAPADPFAFLSSNAPSASERVELPAPPSWQTAESMLRQGRVSDSPFAAAPTADDETIVAELIDDEPADEVQAPAEVHPVVIDAQPLPAEPITLPSLNDTELAQTGTDQVDDVAPGGFVASLEVGGGHGVVTTNALVLPSIPLPELAGPLTSTGEIMITGSIDLPRSLSSTGAHPALLDESALDHELDPGDNQVVSTESQPVRAIKAISTHGSTRGMMTSTKPRGNRTLTILIVATAGMALLVGTLLVVGLMTHAF